MENLLIFLNHQNTIELDSYLLIYLPFAKTTHVCEDSVIQAATKPVFSASCAASCTLWSMASDQWHLTIAWWRKLNQSPLLGGQKKKARVLASIATREFHFLPRKTETHHPLKIGPCSGALKVHTGSGSPALQLRREASLALSPISMALHEPKLPVILLVRRLRIQLMPGLPLPCHEVLQYEQI